MTDCDLCKKNAANGDQDLLTRRGDLYFYKGPLAHKWPGHIMIVSGKHVEEMSDLNMGEAAYAFQEILRTEKFLRSLAGVTRINFVKFGNVCPHLHWHILPRYEGECHLDKNPWELLNMDRIHQITWPRDPYPALLDALRL